MNMQVERKRDLLSGEMGGVNSELTQCSREHERYKLEEKVCNQSNVSRSMI